MNSITSAIGTQCSLHSLQLTSEESPCCDHKSDSISTQPKNSFDENNFVNLHNNFEDDKTCIMDLCVKMQERTISLHSVLNHPIQRYCASDPGVLLLLTAFLGEKILEIEPCMLPIIFSIFEESYAIDKKSYQDNFAHVFDVMANDAHKLVHVFFQNYREEIFVPFLQWWIKMVSANQEIATSLFRNYGHTYFIPLLKENSFDENTKSLLLKCIYLTDLSLRPFFDKINENDLEAKFDATECYILYHADFCEAFSHFIAKKDLNFHDCLAILKLFDCQRMPFFVESQKEYYTLILQKITDFALYCNNEKMATVLYLTLSEIMKKIEGFSTQEASKLSEICEKYQTLSEPINGRQNFTATLVTEKSLASLFYCSWKYLREENDELLFDSQQVIKFLETLDAVSLNLEYEPIIKAIIQQCVQRQIVLPREFLFFHRLAFLCPTVFASQENATYLAIFLFLPFLKTDKNFPFALEALGALSRILVKNQVFSDSIGIEDSLDSEEQKKVIDTVLDFSMSLGTMAWAGSLFFCSFCPSLHAKVLKEQGYDFSVYHKLEVAYLKKEIKSIAPSIEKKIQEAHSKSFWSLLLKTKDSFYSAMVLRFFVPFLPYTEINRVLHDLRELEYDETIIIEIPQLFLKLLASEDPYAIQHKKILRNANNAVNFFFKKEYLYFKNNCSFSAFNLLKPTEKMAMSRVEMEAACAISSTHHFGISKQNTNLLKKIHFLLSTGSIDERIEFVKKIFCSNRFAPKFFIAIFDTLLFSDDLQFQKFTMEKILNIFELASSLLHKLPEKERTINWFQHFFKANDLCITKTVLLHFSVMLSTKEQQKVSILAQPQAFIEIFKSNENALHCLNILNYLKDTIPDSLRWAAGYQIFKKDNETLYTSFLDDNEIFNERCISFFSSFKDEVLTSESYAVNTVFLLAQILRLKKTNTFFSFLPCIDKSPFALVKTSILKVFSDSLFCHRFVKPLLVYLLARAEVESMHFEKTENSFIESMNFGIKRYEIDSYAFFLRKRQALSKVKATKKNIKEIWSLNLLEEKKRKRQHLFKTIEAIENKQRKKEDFFTRLTEKQEKICTNSEWKKEFEPAIENLRLSEDKIFVLRKRALKTLKRQYKSIEKDDRDTIYRGSAQVCLSIQSAFAPENFFSELDKKIEIATSKAKKSMKIALVDHYKKSLSDTVVAKTEYLRKMATEVNTVVSHSLKALDKMELETIANFEKSLFLNFSQFEEEIIEKEKSFAKNIAAAIALKPTSESEKLKSFHHKIEEQKAQLKALSKEKEALESKVKQLELHASTDVQIKVNEPIIEHEDEHADLVEQIINAKDVLQRFKNLPCPKSWSKDHLQEWEKMASHLSEIEKTFFHNLHYHRNLDVSKLMKAMNLFGFQVTTHEGSHFKISHNIFSDVNETLVYHANKQVALPLVKSCYTKMAKVLTKWAKLWIKP